MSDFWSFFDFRDLTVTASDRPLRVAPICPTDLGFQFRYCHFFTVTSGSPSWFPVYRLPYVLVAVTFLCPALDLLCKVTTLFRTTGSYYRLQVPSGTILVVHPFSFLYHIVD